MKKRSKKEAFEDDGRTVANMNVEGMPWYSEAKPLFDKPDYEERSSALDEMNHHETLKLIVNAVLAALAIGGVFLGAVYLFLLFCVQVWFK